MHIRSRANTVTLRESRADFEAGRYVHVPTRAYRWIQTQSPVSRASNSQYQTSMCCAIIEGEARLIRSRNIKEEIEKISAALMPLIVVMT